jgi:predicted dehydrogenase
MTTPSNRRSFLRRTALASLALGTVGGPFIRSIRAGEPGPNSKIRLGLIGCGEMGQGDLECFFLNPEVECVAIADIDDARLAKGVALCQSKRGNTPDTYKDFRHVLDRSDVDAVLIATPDHWHALTMVMAAQAGKDIYVEKPLAKTIDEGRVMAETAHRYNRVVQMGSQWRSAPHIIEAANIIKSGKLGTVSLGRAWAFLDWLPSIGHKPNGPVPAGVDYDMWLGPAPLRPFNPNRFHFNFRWFWDYAGGLMTDWGVHLLNIASMGLADEHPKSVCAAGGKYILDDDSETPDSLVTLYEFPSFQLIWEHRVGLNNGLNSRPWGIEWHGTEGSIIVNDTGWILTPEPKRANVAAQRGHSSGNPRIPHIRNFLDCLSSRRTPTLHLDLGHRVSTLAHLGNIAYRTGDKVVWDSERQVVVDNPKANKLVTAHYRKPWELPGLRTHHWL